MKLNRFLELFVKSCLYSAPLFLLVFYKQTLFPFITVKTYGFLIIIELAVIAWVLLAARVAEFRPVVTTVTKALLVFLGVATVSSLVGINPLASLWSTPERAIGVIALWHFFAFYFALTTFFKKEAWGRYIKYLFWLSVAVALFALLQLVAPSIFYVAQGSRPGGTLGNPAYLAGYLLSYLALGFWYIRYGNKASRYAYGAGSVVLVVSFLNANTRGAMLGLAIGITFLVVATLYNRHKAGKGLKAGLLWLAATAVALAGIIYTTHDAALWKQIPGIDRLAKFSVEDPSITNRLIGWNVALKGFIGHPLFGVGFENFRIVSDQQYDPRLFRAGLGETFFDKPHNVLFELLATTGIFGFAAYLWLLLVVWRACKHISSDPRTVMLARAALVAYFVQNLFIFDTFATYLTFFIAMAALSQYVPHHVGAKKRSALSILALGAIPASLVLIGANFTTLYGNMQHYQTINLFVQDKASEGMKHYRQAMKTYYPFKTLLAQDLLSVIEEKARQTLLPNAAQFIEPALADAETAAQGDATNYFLRITIADAKSVFYRINKKYFSGIDEDLIAAEKLSPNRQQTLLVRAKVKLLRGDKEGALTDLKAAVALDTLVASTHFSYGLILNQYGTGGEALVEFTKALELGYQPKTAAEYAMLGGIFGDSEEYEKAYAFFKAAHELNTGDKEILLKYALVSYYAGKNEDARALFSELIAQEPKLKESAIYPQLQEIFTELGLKVL